MRRSAFTLLELVLVIAVIIALAAVLYPSLEPLYDYYKLSAAADTVKAGMLQARAQAVEEGRPYAFAILPGKGNFRVAPDSPLYWSGAGSTGEDESGIPAFIYEEALPKGIPFTEAEDDSPLPQGEETVLDRDQINLNQWKQIVVFLPDGTATKDVEITLRKGGTVPMVVSLRSLTGSVTVRRASSATNGGR
jgi:type II secretory pathway pseudopilin PulG